MHIPRAEQLINITTAFGIGLFRQNAVRVLIFLFCFLSKFAGLFVQNPDSVWNRTFPPTTPSRFSFFFCFLSKVEGLLFKNPDSVWNRTFSQRRCQGSHFFIFYLTKFTGFFVQNPDCVWNTTFLHYFFY